MWPKAFATHIAMPILNQAGSHTATFLNHNKKFAYPLCPLSAMALLWPSMKHKCSFPGNVPHASLSRWFIPKQMIPKHDFSF
jgi:hypothetical protein